MVFQTAGAVDDWGLLRVTTPKGEPLPVSQVEQTLQAMQTDYHSSPIGFAYPLPLPSVGRIYLWASGPKGQGYTTRSAPLIVERELALNRTDRVSAFVRQYVRRGVNMESAQNRLHEAKSLVESKGTPDPDSMLQALDLAVQAGEEAVVAFAKARLQRMGGREIFLWGAQLHTVPDKLKLFPPLNMVALSVSDSDMDWADTVQQMGRERTALKGENLLTKTQIAEARGVFNNTILQRVQSVISEYRGQIRYWSLFEDLAHFEKQGVARVVAVETVRQVCDVARGMDFGMLRLLAMSNGLYHNTGAFGLVEALLEADVLFECVQLNLCWHDYDLFDFDQLLETVGDWGKPIHLSLNLPPESAHERFVRERSADWFEGACLIALSKPYVVSLQVPMFSSEQSAGLLHLDGSRTAYGERLSRLRS